MSTLVLAGVGMAAAGIARQLFVLSAVMRSRRFLRSGAAEESGRSIREATPPRFFVVVPVLREVALLPSAVTHMRALASGHAAQVIVVTTAREEAEAHSRGGASGTVALARDLARAGECVHLHYPDPQGVKADQLNHAAAWCATELPPTVPSSQAFVVCYDADSRPPLGSLACFERAIAANAAADVFHQSSRFEFRALDHPHVGLRRPRQAVCDAGALRANRFVLGFEIPRLMNRSSQANSLKRAACACVYAHVTGHGLCIRLSLLERLPFPARSPLEDMHYSFILASRGWSMIPVASLDRAEVPGSVSAQIEQAARWFFGPARIVRYLKDPRVRRGWRSWMLAASALGSAAEWLGCALAPAVVLSLLLTGNGPLVPAAAAFASICAAQVVLTEIWLGAPGPLPRRMARVLAFPLACTVHGAGGAVGAARMLAGGHGSGKTERGARP